MDPASAIVGFVTTGIQVVKLVKQTIDDIKNAPKELELLRDRAADTEASLKELECRRLDGLFESQEDMGLLERTGRRAKTCLDEISVFTARVQKTSKDGTAVVDKIRWITKGDTLKGLSGQLDRLDAALNTVMNLVNSRLQSRQEKCQARQEETLTILCTHFSQTKATIEDIHQRLPTLSSRQSTASSVGRMPLMVPNSRAYLTPSDKLSCPSHCACRCHSPLSKPIVPQPLVSYLGQVTVSKRILHAIGAYSWECNVQTCRRDRKTSHRLTWVAWWWYMTVSISSTSFTMSLHPPRVIPDHAPVWGALYWRNVDALQALFAAGEASVFDVAADGQTLLEYAFEIWPRERSEDAVKVIRFLKDAGVDPDFTVDQRWSVAQTISNASLATLIEHPSSNFLHAVRTSTVAVDICRSILNMDVVDILDDYLSDSARHEAAQMLFRSEGRSEDSIVDAEAIIRACGWSGMILYSIWYMPEDVTLRLIKSGVDILKSCVPDAVELGQKAVVKALLGAGADVNGRDSMAYTALHCACRELRVDMLELLVEVAGEVIDWQARTPGGENALQVAKRMQSLTPRPPSDLERIFEILYTHIPDVDEEEGLDDWENTTYAMPGAFPMSASG